MTTQKPVIGSLTLTDLCVFAAYVTMLCVFVPYHEPWPDEAQAWLLSRDLSLYSLLFHNLRYEGHPALWYVLLWIPTHLHMSYGLFNWLSAAIASAGIYVLLRFSPFPLYLRAVLPFTFFLGYQYAVVARSYVLFPLLGFLAATVYRLRRPRPVVMAILLGLLANVSIHGTIVAIALAALYVRDIKVKAVDAAPIPIRRKDMFLAYAIFAGSIAFVAICLWPASDSLPRLTPTLNSLMSHIAITARTVSPGQPAPPIPPALVPLDGNSSSGPVAYSHGWKSVAAHVSARIANLTNVLSYAFAIYRWVALAFEGLVAVYLFRAGKLWLALPFVLLCAFLGFVYAAPWHLGLLWVTCIVILWVAWDAKIPTDKLQLQNIVAVCLVLLCAYHMVWCAKAFAFDLHNQTSPDKEAANYLHTLPTGTRIAGFGTAMGIQPYFDHNIFFNQNETFAYFGADPSRLSLQEAISEHPAIFIVDQPLVKSLSDSNFHETHIFCGSLYFRSAPTSPGCLSVLEPNPPSKLP